jgi:hypothetical protein
MSNEEKNVSLTAKDLKEIIAGAVSEAVKAAKAPNEIEQQKIDQQKAKIAQDNETRRETSAQIKQNMENDAFRKRACAHEGGKPNHSHCVFVSDDLGGFVICQVCRAVIRPENQLGHFPKDFQKTRMDVIFDTALFNKNFQKTDASGLFA